MVAISMSGKMSIRKKLSYLDPFTYVDVLLEKLGLNDNKVVSWLFYLVFALVFALAIYYAAAFALNTAYPMMIVISGSMEPVMYRGDVVVLQGISPSGIKAEEVALDLDLKQLPMADFASADYNAKTITIGGKTIPLTTEGSIIVYTSAHRQIPVIHRAVAKIKTPNGYYFLTKGDSINNRTIDQDCGKITLYKDSGSGAITRISTQRDCVTLFAVHESEIHGVSVFRIPLIGYAKLLIFDDLPKFIFGR